MATRFGRFRAFFSDRPCASRACGHSHLVCLAVKVATLLLLGCGALAMTAVEARAVSFVEFDYNLFSTTRARNSVFVQLYDDRPLTTANFLQYVNGGWYNNTLMHGIDLTPGVLHGGGYYPSYISEPAPITTSLNPAAKVDLDGNPATPNPTVNNEFNNPPLRSNVKGTISMFHPTNDPNGASSAYFFNVIDNSSLLDSANGSVVFGNVVADGMSLIDVYANQLALLNLNPDANHDGIRNDPGPFVRVPVTGNQSSGTFLPLIVTRAKSVDYLGSGTTTDVPAGGITVSNKDVFIDTGSVFTGTGAITIGANRTLGMRENYALNRSLLNHGILAPGLSLGVVGVQGNYFQYSDGLLGIQIGGTTVDTQYDRLISSGTAFLAGRLQVSYLAGFTPAIGNSFTVLTAQSIIGNFTSYDLPQLPVGRLWNIDQSSTAVILTVMDDAGDLNKDGIVDTRDYVYWRKTNGTPAAYQIWRDSLGNRSGGVFSAAGASDGGGLGIGNVPEPSTGFFVLTASLFAGGLARRRRALRPPHLLDRFSEGD